MPYLTGATPPTASTDLRTGLGILGYAHPLLAPTEWGELTRPGTPLDWVVLNVADGPGARPDPHCLEAAGRLRNAGVRVLGHLDVDRLDPAHAGTTRLNRARLGTARHDRAHRGTTHLAGSHCGTSHGGTPHGAHPFDEVISEAQRYLDWYLVDGFFLDRCPTERADLPEVRRTVSTLRALRDEAHIVLGHGTHPHPGYAECADQLVTFRGSWSDYRWSQVAEWTADYPPDRFCHFVHGVPLGHLDEALRIARWQGAATIWFTDHTDRGGRTDPWETMPGYWDEIVSRIGTGVSE
ncbi:spherulation-specific family 4 protein [Streptomyces sp. NBC_00299]|uniref:spherulation-specific family 4 protein n=1 Tax=Streptomyces sp. NBC_00299 TaxID=2975705 RepID=UPI002E2B631F|nr:spherulation-specific family 4 protein [Streptomyces sp. NBC_00299]